MSLFAPWAWPKMSHWIAVAGFFLGVILIVHSIWDWVRGNRKNKSALSNEPIYNIDIIIGYDGHYVETQSFNVYNVMKTVVIGVKNTGYSYLSNCKVYLQAIKPDTSAPEKWLREDVFSLNPGEERFISIAAFNEPLPPHPAQEANLIRPSYRADGTWWQPPMIPQSGGFLTIIAQSAESKPCEVVCKLWVEDDKLHWEKA